MMLKKWMKKATALFLAMAILVLSIPLVAMPITAAADAVDNRTVDPSTMDGWKAYFGPDVMSTAYAGGVWVDKSVFTDVSAFPQGTVTMTDPDNHFLVALSAIASNKEIVGYSTIPTDTMLVLDVSGSMDDNVDELVTATNSAIRTLLATNKNNRVGVVLYSGNPSTGASSYAQGTTLLMPLDRYTTDNAVYIELNNGSVRVNRHVRNADNQAVSASKVVSGGTYIQAGLYEALKQFETADPIIEQDNFQDGQKRLPIMVLMSDGAPTTATHHFAEVDLEYTVRVRDGRQWRDELTDVSTVGNGQSYCATDSVGFLTQLTASYVLNRMETHYDRVGEGLFYTLGLGVGEEGDGNIAVSVLDPEQSTDGIDTFWTAYLELDGETSLELTVPDNGSNNATKNVSIYKNASATQQHYVDEYFYAENASQLNTAFEKIVEEIIIQSRYYPTHLEGGNPDFSGYIVFEDKIGEFMEVKDIKGILLGDTLFTGAMMTSKLNDHNDDGLGTVANPSTLGLEFRDSVKTRLGITDNTDAINLIDNAYKYGQLSYVSDTEFSNYIGWYAKADGTYAGFWHEGVTTAPDTAAYKIKSYGFLGEASGNIKDSDMMFMTVQVRTSIVTGEQTVIWKIPAALVPLVTYKVTLEGNSEANAKNVELTRESAAPICLLFETGLRSDINEWNVAQITDDKHVAADGSRVFWTNYWDNSAEDHVDHETTIAGFTPSEQNERYYYTTNAAIYQKVGDGYVEITDPNHVIDKNGTYYHSRYIFTQGVDTAHLYFEQIAPESLEKAVWDETYVIDDNTVGTFIVPIGTVYRQLDDFQILKSTNATQSIHFANYPYLTMTNASYEADAKLGNNGMLKVVPATGIKISKTVDVVEPDASDAFRFRVMLTNASGQPLSGTYNTLLAALDKTVGTAGTVTAQNGVFEVDLNRDQTIYIADLPAGAIYTVEEIGGNNAYKLRSIHVNGVAVGTVASGTVTQYVIDDIDVVNTPTGDGNLFITKLIDHPFGEDYVIPSDIAFEAIVTLTKNGQPLVGQTYELYTASGVSSVTTDDHGEFAVTLNAGETVAVRGIPEEAIYTVTETEIPADGFTLNTVASSSLTGEIHAEENDHATLVNEYTPGEESPDDGELVVSITKDFFGRDWKDGDSFTFVIEELHPTTRAAGDVIATVTVDNADDLTKTVDLTDEVFTEVGTYHYRIYEQVPSTTDGITYDTEYRRFRVSVTDSDMDGYLEIAGVDNVMNTTVSVDENGRYTVAAIFTNTYAPHVGTHVDIPVQKQMASDNFALNGFRFALMNEAGEYIIHESTLTDIHGAASFRIGYAATDIGTHTYRLAEIDTGINGMTYSAVTYTVVVTVVDNGDGTTSASYVITDENGEAVNGVPTFENSYDPTNALLVLSGQKNLTGRAHNAHEFRFYLYQTDASFALDDLTPIQVVSNDADGSFLFDMLSFEKVGTYYFAVAEEQGNLGGVIYDKTVYTITVQVTDGGGVLVVSSDLDRTIEFDNKYEAKEVDVVLSGSKILTGRDLADGEFTFVLQDENGVKLDSVTNQGNLFAFPTLSYDTTGVYTYYVVEETGTLDGVTYDTAVYTVTVTVTDDSVGQLHAKVSYLKNDLSATAIVFRNRYVAQSLDLSFEGTKTLVGKELTNGQFEFVLTAAVSGGVLGRTTNAADGSFKFECVTVRAAGDYRFRIAEVDTARIGISYDPAVYEVVVTVKDDGNGKLVETARTVTKDGGAIDQIRFVNTYRAVPAALVIRGNKTLTGRDLADGEFTFELYAANDAFETQSDALTAVNAADGTFAFEEIAFGEAGVYHYVVREKHGGETIDRVTYDGSEYRLTVTVKDNGYGNLIVDTALTDILGTTVDSIEFVNVYTPPVAPPDDTPDNPQTGDAADFTLWLALLFVSGGAFTVLAVRGKRKNDERDEESV